MKFSSAQTQTRYALTYSPCLLHICANPNERNNNKIDRHCQEAIDTHTPHIHPPTNPQTQRGHFNMRIEQEGASGIVEQKRKDREEKW